MFVYLSRHIFMIQFKNLILRHIRYGLLLAALLCIVSSAHSSARRTTSNGIISSSVDSIINLNYNGAGPSAVQSVTINGSSLTNNLIVTPPANFEISPLPSSGFISTPITVSPSSGNVSNVTIYVRMRSGLADSTYQGSLLLSSGGANSKTILLKGTVNLKPILTVSTNSISGFKYVQGAGPSAIFSCTVSGISLSSDVVVTAPTNYEISPFGSGMFVSMGSIRITPSNGTLSPTTIYIRLKSGLSPNTYNGNLSVATTGGTTKTIGLSGIVSGTPELSVSSNTVTGIYNFMDTGIQIRKTVNIYGNNLQGDVTVSVPSAFAVSTDNVTYSYGSSLTIPKSALPAKLYIITYIPKLMEFTGNITLSSPGAASVNIAVSGEGLLQPAITVSKSSITSLDYNYNNGPSTPQSFSVSATNLIDSMNVIAPQNFEISDQPGGNYSTQLTFRSTNGTKTINNQTIYARMKSSLANGNYSGNIILNSAYATTKFVSLSGNVSSQPNINASVSSLSGLDYNVGQGPSAEKSVIISGSSLSSAILVVAPENFELSTSSGSSFSATSYILISVSNATASPTTIYIRLKAGLAIADYNESISLISTGVATQNISCSGSVINPVDLTVSTIGNGTVSWNNTTIPSGTILKVNKGTSKTLTLTPGANYKVFSVKYNGVEVKSNVNNNKYSTPAITTNSKIVVEFSFLNDLSEDNLHSERVYGDNHQIVIENFTPGTEISVYTINGILVKTLKVNSSKEELNLSPQNVYLLKTANKVYKVIL